MRVLMAFLFAATASMAEEAPYAGLDVRDIAALSEADIAALEAGEGWGLALPAELNGWPGPRHVLDMGDEIGLSTEQAAAIQAIFDGMNASARGTGAELVAAEAALDAAFETGEIDKVRLAELLASAEAARTRLRHIHLAAHLETAPLLSRHQKMLYDSARGYDGSGAHSDHQGQGHE